jgi:hypothetical protein
MSTAKNQTIRLRNPSILGQPKAVARQLHPFGLTGTWEDMVTVVSLALFGRHDFVLGRCRLSRSGC